ncbi:hypothetical protein K7X08_033768 [Anisodus acutangulus]|uniref:Uncharacterized protein n=1 Tax=Anisodus acutangulus TaxID=402998 RepID=A0A9Q1M674_9SOLA|nr:hypothetical protein K7X08_033768 [Anisodus acutangulus]
MTTFEDVGLILKHVTGGVCDYLSMSNGDRKSVSLFIPYPPLLNTTPTIDLNLENHSPSNTSEESIREEQEENDSGDFVVDNPIGDVENSSEEDGVNGQILYCLVIMKVMFMKNLGCACVVNVIEKDDGICKG